MCVIIGDEEDVEDSSVKVGVIVVVVVFGVFLGREVIGEEVVILVMFRVVEDIGNDGKMSLVFWGVFDGNFEFMRGRLFCYLYIGFVFWFFGVFFVGFDVLGLELLFDFVGMEFFWFFFVGFVDVFVVCVFFDIKKIVKSYFGIFMCKEFIVDMEDFVIWLLLKMLVSLI